MKITVSCPGCQKSSKIDVSHAEKRLRCKQCGLIFQPYAPTVVAEPPSEAGTTASADPVQVARTVDDDPVALDLRVSSPGGSWSTDGARPAPEQRSRSERFAQARQRQKFISPPRNVSEEFINTMFNIGFSLLTIGIMASVLPLFGFQLRRLRRIGPAGIVLGIPLIATGAILMAGARSRDPKRYAVIGALTGTGALVMMVGGVMFAGAFENYARRLESRLGNIRQSTSAEPGDRLEEIRSPSRSADAARLSHSASTIESTIDPTDNQQDWSQAVQDLERRVRESVSQSRHQTTVLSRWFDLKARSVIRSKTAALNAAAALAGISTGNPQYVALEEPVIGFDFVFDDSQDSRLKRMVPVYEFGQHSTQAIVAKPGYVVTGIRVNTDRDGIDGFQLVFHRFDEGIIDDSDSYRSAWKGEEAKAGGIQTTVTRGGPARGILCYVRGLEIRGIALIDGNPQ